MVLLSMLIEDFVKHKRHRYYKMLENLLEWVLMLFRTRLFHSAQKKVAYRKPNKKLSVKYCFRKNISETKVAQVRY